MNSDITSRYKSLFRAGNIKNLFYLDTHRSLNAVTYSLLKAKRMPKAIGSLPLYIPFSFYLHSIVRSECIGTVEKLLELRNCSQVKKKKKTKNVACLLLRFSFTILAYRHRFVVYYNYCSIRTRASFIATCVPMANKRLN